MWKVSNPYLNQTSLEGVNIPGIWDKAVQAQLRKVVEDLQKHMDLNAYGKMPGMVFFTLSIEEWAELRNECGKEAGL